MKAAACMALAAWLGMGCSALVSPEDEPINCLRNPGDSDPCPRGLLCIDGTCQVRNCELVEQCDDGIDNNCNGEIDELVDADGDGAPVCSATPDCDDADPQVFPGRVDGCDGIDNDCDRAFDEDAACDPKFREFCSAGRCIDPMDCSAGLESCRADEFCDTSLERPRCTMVASGCTPGSCPDHQICDPGSGTCIDRPTMIGQECVMESDCTTGGSICVPFSALRLPMTPAAAPTGVCTDPCCGPEDCGPDRVCWSPGNGVRACVPPMALGMMPGQPLPWVPCAGGCASGECRAETVMFGGGRFTVMACGSPDGIIPAGYPCLGDGDCESGVCFNYVCTLACGETEDCRIFEDGACGYWSLGREPSSRLPVCVAADRGTGRAGDPCASNSECRDGRCRNRVCQEVCCVSSQCEGGRECRPFGADTATYWMFCQ